jgi:hypothetical protein
LQPNLPTAVATGAAIGSLRTLKKAKGTLVPLGCFFGNNIIDGIGRCRFETPPSQTPLYCPIRHSNIGMGNRDWALDGYPRIDRRVATIHHFPPATLDLTIPLAKRFWVYSCSLISAFALYFQFLPAQLLQACNHRRTQRSHILISAFALYFQFLPAQLLQACNHRRTQRSHILIITTRHQTTLHTTPHRFHQVQMRTITR